MRNLSIQERVEQFNAIADLEEYELMFGSDEDEDIEWNTYSVTEIQNQLSITEEEANLLLKSGLFTVYRCGHEYRASKKSVDDKRKILNVLLTYRNKKTMKVMDMSKILGLGKTSTYRLLSMNHFKVYMVLGVMRIDVESFEEWYAGQFHYKKVNGERPGQKYGYTIAPITVAKVLGIPKSTAKDLIDKELFEHIVVDGKRRVVMDSFKKWLDSQDKYKMVQTVEEAEGYDV